MEIGELLRGYQKTKRHLHTAEMNAAGWKVGQTNIELLNEPAVFIYMYDLPTKFIWMANIPLDEFVQISSQSGVDSSENEMVINALYALLSEVANGVPPAPIDGLDWENMLALLLSAYAGTTKIWRMADQMRKGGHFVVINYRSTAQDKGSLLRPFALTDTDNKPLSATDFEQYVARVIEMDKERHPEWFNWVGRASS